MASIPTNGYAEVMAGTNNYSGSNSFDGSCPRTAIPPVIGDDLTNKTYVDTATGGGIIGTLTDKGSLITANGTNAVIFDQNPYQTALTTTTVYDWNALAIGQSRDFTTTFPTLIPLGSGITITYSGTDSIKGNITAVAGSVITITITNLASLSYSSAFLLQTSGPSGSGGNAFDAIFPFNPAVTTPNPPNIPANTIITDGEGYLYTSAPAGTPVSITPTIIGSNIQRPTATPFNTIPYELFTVTPTPFNFPSGCFVGTTQSPSVQFASAGQTYRVGIPSGGTFLPRNYVGSLSGYTVGYSTGSIVIDDDICLIADALSPTGLAWGVINAAAVGAVTSVSGGVNIVMSGTVPAPVVNLRNPLTAELNMGSQSLRDSASAVGTSGQVLSAGTGGQTLWTAAPVSSVSGGTNIVLSGTATAPVVNLRNPLTAELNMGSQSLRDSANNIGTSGQFLSAGTGGQTLWATSSAANINITDTNTNATYYPTFVAGSGSQSLLADIATTQVSLNPSNGNYNVVDTLKLTQSELAIGKSAGAITQGTQGIAIGLNAGNNNQAANCVAIGGGAGALNQQLSAVAVGNGAGNTTQGQFTVAIGVAAGSNTQETAAIAIGNQAGFTTQRNSAVAIGGGAGTNNQGIAAVAVGSSAGSSAQGAAAVAIGQGAGSGSQGGSSIAIGQNAGATTQGSNCIALGQSAGNQTARANCIAIGLSAGQFNQGQAGSSSVAVGESAGNFNQGSSAVSIGTRAGATSQGAEAVAISSNAGENTQGIRAVAVGYLAGQTSQGARGISIGFNAGNNTQSADAVAIGHTAGRTTQGTNAVAVGNNSGNNNQGASAVAIGNNAGQGTTSGQGANAIAIGNNAGVASQTAGSICLNASGLALNPNQAGLFIDPIRSKSTGSNILSYDTTTKEVSSTNNLAVENITATTPYNFSVISIFTDATARNTALPSPYTGQFCFLTGSNQLQFYNGGWNNAIGQAVLPTISGFTLGSNYEIIYVNASNTVVGSAVNGGFTIVRFYPTTTTSGTISLSLSSAITYLIVGGGGGGAGAISGTSNGGGGGGGGYVFSTDNMLALTSYSLQVGGGGTGGAGASGLSGTNSTLAVASGTITATGGGAGGAGNGGAGGCGGGGAATTAGTTSGGIGSQGQNGGGGVGSGNFYSGGGGGATSVGAGGGVRGDGGAGTANTITGASITYAGGGGGGSNDTSTNPALGGAGGGGAGGAGAPAGTYTAPTAGTDGRGGGGGGGGQGSTGNLGFRGGAGVVIVRFSSFI